MASACIVEKLKYVLPTIINEDQTVIFAWRYTGENIRMLYDIMYYIEKYELPEMLLLTDFENALDSVYWDFL